MCGRSYQEKGSVSTEAKTSDIFSFASAGHGRVGKCDVHARQGSLSAKTSMRVIDDMARDSWRKWLHLCLACPICVLLASVIITRVVMCFLFVCLVVVSTRTEEQLKC